MAYDHPLDAALAYAAAGLPPIDAKSVTTNAAATAPPAAARKEIDTVAQCRQSRGMTVELTHFTKANGPLTKRISLVPDGTLKCDGSACVMARGEARRLSITGIGELATVIEAIRSDQAIALGTLRAGLPDQVRIVTKQKLNGQSGVIARTSADIVFRKQQPALALLSTPRACRSRWWVRCDSAAASGRRCCRSCRRCARSRT